jgi:hypothetical protein
VRQHSDLSLRRDRGSELLEQIRVQPRERFSPVAGRDRDTVMCRQLSNGQRVD